MASDRGLAVARSGRCDDDRAQVAIDIEEAQMGANQAERLGLGGRQDRPLARIAPPGSRKRAALGNDAEHGQVIDLLDILRSLDPAVESLEHKGETEAYEQAQRPTKKRVPRRLRGGRAGRRQRFLSDLNTVVIQPREEGQRLGTVLELYSVRTEPLRLGEFRQLLVHKRQRRPEVPTISALLPLHELPDIRVRNARRQRRGGRGGRDINDARFSYPRYAQAASDLYIGQTTTEQIRGLRRSVPPLTSSMLLAC